MREQKIKDGEDPGVRYQYDGESSRGCYERFQGHVKTGQGGFMHQHTIEQHNGHPGIEFVIKREKIDKDPMRRQLRESIRIESASRDESIELLNSKEEHFGTQTVRAQFGRNVLI